MKKKITAFLVVLVCLLTGNGYAQNLTFTETNGEVAVTAEGFDSNALILMSVYTQITNGGKTETYIKQIDKKTTDGAGAAIFNFKFFITDPSTVYTVSVQDETMVNSAKTVDIEFVNLAAIQKINDAGNATELYEAVRDYGTALNIDSAMINDLDNPLETAGVIFGKKASGYTESSFQNFQDLYFETCALELVKEAEATELEGILSKYDMGIDVSASSDFSLLPDKVSMSERIAGKNFLNLENLKNAWDEQLGLEIINTVIYPALYTWMTNSESKLSKNYETLLGFGANTTYQNLIDKKAPYATIAGNDYTTKEEALNAFGVACTEQYNKEPHSEAPQGGGGGGGGGSGSGSRSDVSDGLPAVMVDMSDEIKTEENLKESEAYSDISNYGWAKEAIEILTDKGIVSGTGNGKFEPHREVKREEFLKMLIEALQLPCVESENKFSDVSANDWYYDYVATGVETGIINGVSETAFGSGKPITRADMTVMLERASKLVGVELKAIQEYTEFNDYFQIPEYARSSVQKVQLSGIVNGYSDLTFKPLSTATRAESAVVIYKLLNIK